MTTDLMQKIREYGIKIDSARHCADQSCDFQARIDRAFADKLLKEIEEALAASQKSRNDLFLACRAVEDHCESEFIDPEEMSPEWVEIYRSLCAATSQEEATR